MHAVARARSQEKIETKNAVPMNTPPKPQQDSERDQFETTCNEKMSHVLAQDRALL